jgi:HK97 family phage major capsid protein
MKRNQRLLKATEQTLAQKAEELLELGQAAESENRELTEDEQAARETLRGEITELKAKAEELKGKIEIDDEIETLASGLKGDREAREERKREPITMGEQFIESDGYRNLVEKGLTGKWSSGHVDVRPDASLGYRASVATLLEGTGASPGAGGALVPEDRRPGVLPILFERLTVADLLASGMTTSNLIRYVVETVADNSAVGTVAEGADKPEVELELDLTDEPVSKIAAFLPVSDEMLEDAAQIRSYLDARLGLFVRIEEENQLLNGDGTGTDLDGILNRVPAANEGINSDAADRNKADDIFAAITVARESFLEPDGIVVNTDDWADIRLLKDDNGNYIGGSPFSNDRGEPGETLWGKRVVVTSAMAAGTALVGAFRTAAQVFRRGGLTVEASNSHSDYFRKNLTAVRAEERLGLAVYRPAAFATASVAT